MELHPLVSPAIGLIFWTTVAFLFLLVVLRAFAWKPILGAVKEREESITESLKQAEIARDEMKNLQAENQNILKEAREERSKLLKEAKLASDSLINDAKEKAKTEASKIAEEARKEIQTEKMAALAELKSEVGAIAISIAERLLKKELSGKEAQEKYVSELVNDLN